MQAFDYYDAHTIDEAINLLKKYHGEAVLLAGGTDLLVKAKHNAIKLKSVVDVSKISALKEITLDGNTIRIGAGAKLSQIVESGVINKHAGVLADAANLVGSIQVRNMATIGGNVANAAPSADTITPLLILNAQAVLAGPEGESRIPVKDLFKGPGLTVLSPFEIIKEFIVPCVPKNTGTAYLKHSRRKAMDVATVGCAVRVEIDPNDHTIKDAAIALGAVAPTAVLVKGVAEQLKGQKPDLEMCAKLSELALSQVAPISDVRSTKEYRNQMIKLLVKQAIKAAYSNATNRG